MRSAITSATAVSSRENRLAGDGQDPESVNRDEAAERRVLRRLCMGGTSREQQAHEGERGEARDPVHAGLCFLCGT
jgi:hypothetical protein